MRENHPLGRYKATMKDRIKAIMKDLNMTQGDFAKFLGIHASILSSIFNGRTNPTLSTVTTIREKIPTISYLWLIDGIGDMYVPDANGTASESPVNQSKGGAAGHDFTGATRENGVNLSLEFGDNMKNPYKPTYRVKEIRVYFDDQHFETFIPDKT